MDFTLSTNSSLTVAFSSRSLLLLNVSFKESIPNVSTYSCLEKENCSGMDSRLLFVGRKKNVLTKKHKL
jgi:hypothetical protein